MASAAVAGVPGAMVAGAVEGATLGVELGAPIGRSPSDNMISTTVAMIAPTMMAGIIQLRVTAAGTSRVGARAAAIAARSTDWAWLIDEDTSTKAFV